MNQDHLAQLGHVDSLVHLALPALEARLVMLDPEESLVHQGL